jgi:predicted DCC family thiol-disulfide oxidoreductase YuxK
MSKIENVKVSIFMYDGNCGVCDATVDFLLKKSSEDELHFSSIQSDFARKLLAEYGIFEPDLTTAYFADGSRLHEKSDAVIYALGRCTGLVRFLVWLRFVPKTIRDQCYDLFSKNRHEILKNDVSCRIPSESERRRIHDI